MAKFASIKIRERKDIKPPTIHSLLHNNRLTADPSYLLDKEYRQDNYHLTKFSNATKVWSDWEQQIYTRYEKENNRILRSDAITIEEGLIVLSDEQVKKCSSDDIWKNAQEFKKWFEKRFNTEILSLDWHRDEGDEEDGKVIYNEHIHFLFSDVDMDGIKIRNKWKRSGAELSEMQDKIAEIFEPLGFIRGLKEGHKPYRKPADQRIESAKNKVRKEKNATIAQLNKANTQLKQELTGTGLLREDFADIEKQVKDLKDDIRAKEVTEIELQSIIETLRLEAFKTIAVRKKVGTKVATIKKEVSYKTLYNEVEKSSAAKTELTETFEERVAKIQQVKKTVLEIRAKGKAKREATASTQEQITLVHSAQAEKIDELEVELIQTQISLEEQTALANTIPKEIIVIKEDTTRVEELESTIAIQEDSLIAKDVEIASLKLELLNALSKLMKISCRFIDRIKTGLSKVHDTHEIAIDDDTIQSTMGDNIEVDTNPNPGM